MSKNYSSQVSSLNPNDLAYLQEKIQSYSKILQVSQNGSINLNALTF